ncbi:flagellar basal body L-ring protein FlgH [Pseudoalteromonas sp. McH1-7]|uniref:Flagellar L-ring protein n=1 Tax=Pseudoalteromonas peptidolytica F12-50-A1 TaxID=1315280 RepID=A0A8I0MXJ4_9GAMM|nr:MULTISPECIES: flagellar basal body L-ring protein FlgH [Pseudoalteromonas]MBE0346904.1 flagellar L-ring protein precursor FlgH [Pseudoalteromonas peptidolytica F12-50-A1]MDW7550071.1 flagellar basal body L-ring protein FlgH [Pseudoalteromonas peptidolytica]NLR13966.1 flagellar basal body L-ring protein FlgH [Pseudoalteromonas peptidolytica]NUZ09616.1 flagellar basal body L-ring protein FlgH [Pseudoalteromonas sp. McH1-7]RRS09054.1 flagellar basal body L-ring protein FlgH [Pseudoalteromonas 
MRALYLAIVTVAALSGCSTTQNKSVVRDDPYYAPIYPEDNQVQIVATGSLFNTQFSNDLYADKKALRVGDIITIVLRETTQATKAANSELDKSSDSSLDPIIGLGANAINIGNEAIQFGAKSSSSFSGDSKSNQSNSLFGNISVNVTRVLPNGNLVIRGEKWLTLNTGEEFIRLEGLVRPQDVTADNTVESNRVANARIQYSGKGDQQEVQSAGWLTSFFMSAIMPF